MHTTQHHPTWDATTGQWVLAANLRAGDRLRSSTGTVRHRDEV